MSHSDRVKIQSDEKPKLIRPVPSMQALAKTVQEISIDFIEVENRTLRSRWFHGEEELDLFVWMDDKGRLFKAQANVMGQVLEWNIMGGVQTGVYVEEERNLEAAAAGSDGPPTTREQILFDAKIKPRTQSYVLEFVEHLTCLEDELKSSVCEAFRGEAALALARAFQPVLQDPFEAVWNRLCTWALKLWR